MDIAYLNIKNFQADNRTTTVSVQNSDCWKCPFIDVASLDKNNGSSVNTTLYANHTTTINISHTDYTNNTTTHICSWMNLEVREGAQYQILVTNDLDHPCDFITLDAGQDSFLPILYMSALLLALSLLWILLKQLHRRHCFLKCNMLFGSPESEALVKADLGSTNSVTTEVTNSTHRAPRLRSLDTFRGLSLTIMIFVNYGGGGYWFFQHSSWNGLTVADLVFPWFVFIMGTAMALVFSSIHRKTKSRRQPLQQILFRSAKLFILGLTINSLGGSGNDITQLRIPGVLQRFALSYLVVALTELTFAGGYIKTVNHQDPRWHHKLRDVLFFWPSELFALLCLVTHIAVTKWVPYDLNDCPTGYVGPGGLGDNRLYVNCTGGIAKYIDLKVFGPNHIYQWSTCMRLYGCVNHDPEGLLGTLTSIVMCFLGLQAGRILVIYPDHKSRIIRWVVWSMLLGGAALALCGADQNNGWIPINKNLWSASFVLALSAMANLLLAFLYLVIDVLKVWTGAPFFYPGMNSIAVYIGSELLEDVVPVSFAVSNTHMAQLFMNLWSCSFWVMFATYMYYKGVFIAL